MAERSPYHFSRIEGGRFTARAIRQLITSLEGKDVEVSIRKRRSYRSLDQNSYLHGVVFAMIGDALREAGVTGPYGGPITDEEVKELMKMKFLRVSVLVNPATGEYIDMVKNTRDLTRSEMMDFITQLKQFGVEDLNIQIPDPGEQLTFA